MATRTKNIAKTVVFIVSIISVTSAFRGESVRAETILSDIDAFAVSPESISYVVEEPIQEQSVGANSTNISRGTTSVYNQVVSYAYNFIGTPYIYGANGPNSFDCSGFTKYVFSSASINLPRTSQLQFSEGNKIDRENLQVGDLVFFNTDTNLGHVGIYIGNDEFIHASLSKGVTISSLNNPYYAPRYAGAVRY